MMSFGILLLRYNIKLFSFLNLFLVFIVIIALFPKYIFSLSLWFSILGVFYIFLYIHYFKDIKNWLVHIILFNFWIYFAMNPIVHYFFDVLTIQQLLSPFLTMLFSIFYPIELFLHLIDSSGVFDSFLIWFFSVEFTVFNVSTPMWFFAFYLMVSLFSINNKKYFILLNILLILFSTYLHSFTLGVHQYF